MKPALQEAPIERAPYPFLPSDRLATAAAVRSDPALLPPLVESCLALSRIDTAWLRTRWNVATKRYAELFRIFRDAGPDLWPLACADGRLPPLRPQLQHLRAAYEAIEERQLAAAPETAIRRALDIRGRWAAAPALLESVSGAAHVLLAGAGAFPATAIALARRGVFVDCIEADAEACELGHALVARLALGDDIRYRHGDIRSIRSFEEYDCVVTASLLGMPHDGAPRAGTRADALAHIVRRLGTARLVVRDPQGVLTLVYPSARLLLDLADVRVERHACPLVPGTPHLADIVVVRRT